MEQAPTNSKLYKIREDIENQSESVLSKEKKTVKDKYFKKINRSLESLTKIVNDFKVLDDLENVASTEKYSHRIYEGVSELLNNVEFPENINLQSTSRFYENLKSKLDALTDSTLSKYIKLLDKKYQKRVKSLDKAYGDVYKQLENLKKYLDEKYKPKSNIEQGLWLIDDIISNIDRLNDLISELQEKTGSLKEKDQDIENEEKELEELENHPLQKEFTELREKYKKLQTDLDIEFSDIKKAIKKYVNKQSKSKDRGDLTVPKEFISDPATSIAKNSSVNSIKGLLTTIKDEITSQEIHIKKDKKESTLKQIDEMLGSKLDEIYDSLHKMYVRRGELEEELKDLNLDMKITKIKEHIEGIKRDKIRIVERELREAENIRESTIKDLETVSELTNQDLEVKVPEIPELH